MATRVESAPGIGRDGGSGGPERGTLDLSVVVPIYNEEANIPLLYQKLRKALEAMPGTWEVVCVDDGSTDESFRLLRAVAEEDPRVRVVRFRRNFGQTAALTAGFRHAVGRVIVTIDGDLQNDPTDIPRLLAKLQEGYDIVSGWRRSRKDRMLSKRLPSLVSNRIASWLTGVRLHDYGCTLKAYRREVVEQLQLYGEMHRFIPAAASWMGVKVAEVEVEHHPRRFGKSKYGVGRIIRGFLDLLTLKLVLSYMTRPMQIFGTLGLLSILGAFLCGALTVLTKAFLGVDMTGNPLLYLSVLLTVVGLQFVSLGFLGEIAMRTYHESQRKCIYVVREVVNGSPASSRPDGEHPV